MLVQNACVNSHEGEEKKFIFQSVVEQQHQYDLHQTHSVHFSQSNRLNS